MTDDVAVGPGVSGDEVGVDTTVIEMVAESGPIGEAKPAKRLPLHPSGWQGALTWDGKPTIRTRLMQEPDWEAIEARLRGGIAPWTLAKEVLQRPHLADMGMKSTERVLSRIRETLSRSATRSSTGKALSLLPVQFRSAVEKLQGLPEIRKLTKMIADQAKRVESGLKLEQSTNMLLPGVKEEVELLWKMQLSLIEAKQKLGLLHAEPMKMQALLGIVTGGLNGGNGQDGAQDLPKTLDAAGRQRVLQAVKKMRNMLGTRLSSA